MPIEVRCPKCRKGYRLPEKAAGRRVPCKACGTPISVPRPPADDDDFLDDLDDLDDGDRLELEAAPRGRRAGGREPGSRPGKTPRRASGGRKSGGNGALLWILLGGGGLVVLLCCVALLLPAVQAARDAAAMAGDTANWEPSAFANDPAVRVSFPKPPKNQEVPGDGVTYVAKAADMGSMAFLAWGEGLDPGDEMPETPEEVRFGRDLVAEAVREVWAADGTQFVSVSEPFKVQGRDAFDIEGRKTIAGRTVSLYNRYIATPREVLTLVAVVPEGRRLMADKFFDTLQLP